MSTVYFRFAGLVPPVRVRAPLLERLLARADASVEVLDWRAQAWASLTPQGGAMPSMGATVLHTESRGVGERAVIDGWAFVATPVRLVAGMSSVHMAADGVLELSAAEADQLAADFGRVFGGAGMTLRRGHGSVLACLFDAPVRVETTPPERVAGEDVWNHMPRGEHATRLRRFMSELEMWLHEHPVNLERAKHQLPPVTQLWLWGGGPAHAKFPEAAVQPQGSAGSAEPAGPPGRGAWAAGNDPLRMAFVEEAQYPGASRSGLVVTHEWPGTAAWAAFEQNWLAPIAHDLGSRRLGRIDLSGGARCISVSPRGTRRFWRRVRPWWESFGLNEHELNEHELNEHE